MPSLVTRASRTAVFGTPPRDVLIDSTRPSAFGIHPAYTQCRHMPIDRPFDFGGATALVVGGASGLGRAMAETLAQHGASVCITARSEDKARAVAEEISTRAGGRCESC